MTCGIYLLNFPNTNKVYVGQSKDIEKRYREHISSLSLKSASVKLNSAVLLFGMPTLTIIEECTTEYLTSKEEEYITKFNSVALGFNTMSRSGNAPEYSGENAPGAIYSNVQIEAVFNLLLNPLNTVASISSITGVSISAIAQVSSGATHSWLNLKFPVEYLYLIELNGNRQQVVAETKSTSSTSSKYSTEQYLEVLALAVQGKKAKDINKLTNVNIDVIRDITSCRRHKWLEKAHPVNYSKLKQIKGK